MGSLGRGEETNVFLIFGGNGWFGSQLKEILQAQGKEVIISSARIENREQVMNELLTHAPTRVINCAGVRGWPNADWCEDNKVETYRSNVLGPLNLVDCCFLMGIHVTHFGSACIYDTPPELLGDGGQVFTESDEPFYTGSWYSRSRLVCESTIRHYPNLLLLRPRLPVAADLERNNTITRLMKYAKILSLPGSGTVLPNLLPGAVLLSEHAETGIYNFVNPGAFTNNEILEIVKKHLRPELEWENFDITALHKALKAPRCNCVMDATKLVAKCKEYGWEIKESHAALEDCVKEMAAKGM